MLVDEARPAAKSDFMADARRAYEAKHPGKKLDVALRLGVADKIDLCHGHFLLTPQ